MLNRNYHLLLYYIIYIYKPTFYLSQNSPNLFDKDGGRQIKDFRGDGFICGGSPRERKAGEEERLRGGSRRIDNKPHDSDERRWRRRRRSGLPPVEREAVGGINDACEVHHVRGEVQNGNWFSERRWCGQNSRFGFPRRVGPRSLLAVPELPVEGLERPP